VECWNFLGIHWVHELYFFDTIIKAKRESQHDYMEVFSIAAWEIWKQRNAKIFRGTPTSFFQSWKINFLGTVKQQMYRLNQDNRIRVQDWISSLL
jgi:hypothetical protein